MRAKRCFDVKYKDGQRSCIRWILTAPAHPEFMLALNVLKQTRILDAVQIKVEEDRATMSKAAKEIRDALKASGNGGGSSSGPKRRQKKRTAGHAQLEFGCAHRQSVVRDSLVRVLRGEPRHGQARSPERRSSPWPGRCKLGSSQISKIFECASCGMHTECGG